MPRLITDRMGALRYTGPSGVTYAQVVTAVSDDGQPVTYAPYTLDNGDVIDAAVNPDERVFVPSKAQKVKDPDNADTQPDTVEVPADPVVPPAPNVADLVAPLVDTTGTPVDVPDGGPAADATPTEITPTAEPAVPPADNPPQE